MSDVEDVGAPPDTGSIDALTIYPFVHGRLVLPLPVWTRSAAETYWDGAYLAPVAQAGVRPQRMHVFARRGSHGYAWIDADVLEFDGERRFVDDLPGDPMFRRALETFREDTDDAYWTDIQFWLEEAYLKADTVYGGSGHSAADDDAWRARMGVHAEAVDRDGTLLDTGCANGLLMESMVVWAAERGFRLEPYGLDISPRQADVARRRLPHWADRIYVGNCFTWEPPIRFDYVVTRLEYVREPRRRELAQRLLRDVVARGGRLIVTSYGCTMRPSNASVAERLHEMGFEATELVRVCDKGRQRSIAYVDRS